MNPQKRQRLMFALLIASVLFGLYMKPWERRHRVIPVLTSDTNFVNAAAPATAEPSGGQVVFANEWPERDPFTRSDEYVHQAGEATDAVSIGEPTFALQGIMTVGGQKACVIDGLIRTAGSQCSGWRVDRIEDEGVWVSQGGERRFVPLP